MSKILILKIDFEIRFWHFLTAIFGHLTRLMKKSNPFLRSVQLYLQSEMFLSNSVDMMKNLHQAGSFSKVPNKCYPLMQKSLTQSPSFAVFAYIRVIGRFLCYYNNTYIGKNRKSRGPPTVPLT